MPFTPLHMGPGILVKAIFRGSFSIMVFGWAQILMDVQPLVVLYTNRGNLHGFSHTTLAATLLAVVAAVSGRYLGEVGLKLIGRTRYIPIRWPVAWISAAIGTFSHVALDSLIYPDMPPPMALDKGQCSVRRCLHTDTGMVLHGQWANGWFDLFYYVKINGK